MAEPAAAPIASSSSTKIRKPKKSKGKSRQDRPASHDVDAAAFGTPTRSEGTAVHPTTPAHVAPQGRDPADYEVEFGDFDYDAVKAEEGAELWLVRAPTAVKAKGLQGLEISSRIGLVGDLMRKSTAYDLWALEPRVSIVGGAHASTSTSGGEDQDKVGGTATVHVGVSAEELGSLSVLLPRKRKGGKLYLSPKPVTRHLVVAARPAEPTKPDTASDSAVYQNPQREAYPEEALKHRFRPYGDPGDPPPEHHTDVEMAAASTKEKEKEKPKRKGGEAGSSKKKKAKLAAS